MPSHRFFRILIFLAFTINVRSQYFDFIQGLQAFIQPYQATNQYYGQTTKRPQTKTTQNIKSIYDSSVIVFQDNTTKKPRTTSSRPRKTTRKNINTDTSRNLFGSNQNFESTTQNLIHNNNTNIKRIQNDNPSAITFLDEHNRKIQTNLTNNKLTTNNYDNNNRGSINNENKKVVNNNFARPQKIINPNFESKPPKQQVSFNKNQGINNNFESLTQKTDVFTTHKPFNQYQTVSSNLNGYTTQRPGSNTNNQGYNNKNQDYNTNNQAYNTNNQAYNTNNQGYNTNNQAYNTNNQAYNTNNQDYNTNNQAYNTNNQAYNTNNQAYNTNNQAYNTNNQAYNTNNQGYSNNKPGFNNNLYTTQNPFVRQPGVKPANVDENQPPITNSPVTDSFLNLPGFDSNSEDGWESPIEIGPNEDDMTQSEKRRYVELAEEVCNEYKARTVKKVVALPLVQSGQGLAVNVSDCTPINIPLIIGGRVSTIEEFPHMALVGWRLIRGGYTWKCGGSLISDEFVLTAGHCTFQEKDNNAISGPPHAVQLGSSIMDDPRSTVIQAASVIRHPKYKRRRVYHDVAIIKLIQRVSFSDVIRPACLGRPPGAGEPIIATGWGRTEFGGAQSRELRSVSLPIWNIDECREVWGTSRKLPNGPISDNQLCAGEKSGGKDTCQGDSGGPAQIQDGCVWRVVAVTSYGRSCGAPQTPALYAKIPIPFVAAKVFADRLKSQSNLNIPNYQINYGAAENYDGYQNDGNQNNYNQPKYGSNQQGYDSNQPNYNQNQQNDRYTPNYSNNQQNYGNNEQKQTSNYPNYDRPQPDYNNQNYGINRENYEKNQPNYNNQENYNRYQPNYSIQNYEPTVLDYNNNPSNYYRKQHNYGQPNYGYSGPNYENNYRIPEATPWWTQ